MPRASDATKTTAPAAPLFAGPGDAKVATTAADPLAGLGFTPLDEASEFTNALFFGEPGTGKTTAAAFAANLPGDGITVFVNAESGLKKAALKALGVDTSKIVIFPDPEKGEKLDYNSLENLLYRLSNALRVRPGCVKVTSFDSLTEVTTKLMEEITARAYEKDQNMSEIAKARRLADGKKLRENKFETQLQDYGLMTSQVRSLIRSFRDLPCHFVATALQKDDVLSDGGVKQIGPEMSPKLSVSVRGYFDLVFQLEAETLVTGPKEQTTLVTANTKTTLRLQAKDRLGMFPITLPTPTFDRIVSYVRGEITAADDPEFARHRAVRVKADAYHASRKSAK